MRGGRTPRPSLEGRTVLVLEDEGLIVLDARLALEEAGARVLAVGSVGSALSLLDGPPPDVALLDLTLAGGTNAERVALRLAELDVPYVVHSGDVQRHRSLLSRLGNPDVLQKPYPSHHLAGHLASLLDARERSGR